MIVTQEKPHSNKNEGLLLPAMDDNAQSISQLVKMANRFNEDRDKLICQGLVIRGLANSSPDSHERLLTELLRQRDDI